jgi:hypothetical protein
MYFFNFLENFGWNLAEIFGDPPRRVSVRNPDNFRHTVDTIDQSDATHSPLFVFRQFDPFLDPNSLPEVGSKKVDLTEHGS